MLINDLNWDIYGKKIFSQNFDTIKEMFKEVKSFAVYTYIYLYTVLYKYNFENHEVVALFPIMLILKICSGSHHHLYCGDKL